MTDQTHDQNRQFLTLLDSLGIATHRLDQIRDAARLHRQQRIGSSELYAVIEAGDAVPSAVPAPATDRAGLREQIAEALAAADGWAWTPDFDKSLSPVWQGYLKRAAVVVPLLPASVDRATVLNEAADHLARQAANALPSARDVILADVAELRRLAVEARDGHTTQGEAPCSDPIECSHEAALGQAQQEIRRLGLMVDEYGHGASALSEKLKRVREAHRKTCPFARGELSTGTFFCGQCEVLDTPTVMPPPALTEVGRLRAQVEVLQQDAERDQGLAKVGARCMRVGHQGLIESGRAVLEGWRFAFSTALDLGTGAPWESIHERVKELTDQPAVVAAVAGEAPAVCICGHPGQQHFEDVCIAECGCSDFLTAEGAAEERARAEAAIHALRSAAEQVRIGLAVGPIPLEVRPAVAAWLRRLADQRRDRAIARAVAVAEQKPKGARS